MSKQVFNINLPSPSPGTERSIQVRKYGDPEARPCVYIQTALHADEIPGMLLLHYLDQYLTQCVDSGRMLGQVIVVPVANPIGMSQRIQGRLLGRLDQDDGRNFNRYFPDLLETVLHDVQDKLGSDATKNHKIIRQSLDKACTALPRQSAPQAQRAELVSLAVNADICLDLHSDQEAILHMFSGYSKSEVVMDLAAQLGCELVLLAEESGGNPFDEVISDFWARLKKALPEFPIHHSCMGATVELRGERDVDDRTAQQDAQNLFQFLINQSVVQGESKTKEPLCEPTPLTGVVYMHTPVGGVVVYHCQPGDQVEKDDVIATIIDPLAFGDDARIDILSPVSGKVFAHVSDRMISPGQKFISIAGKEALDSRIGTHLLSD